MKTSKWLLIMIIVTFSIIKINGQSVISTAGGSYRDETISLSFTLGEPLADTYKPGNVVLTQGFQQPYNFYQTLTLNIPEGWSGVSTWLDPMNKGVQKVFASCVNDLVILMSISEVYIPSMGVNTIGDWDYLDGYKIKTTNDINLTITGSKIANPKVNLPGGWSLMPVLSECPVDVAGLFAPVAGNLRVMKEVAGFGVYWPEMGYNTIGSLWPGKAYFVLTYNPVEVAFGECTKGSAANKNQPVMENMPALSPWPLMAPTSSSHTCAILPEALSCLGPGSIVGLFDQSGNCHSIDVTDNGIGYLTAFGDDAYTALKDGFEETEPFLLKVLNPDNGNEYQAEAVFDQKMSNTGSFAQNGLSVIKSLKATGIHGIGNDLVTISVYPNPSASCFNIRLSQNIQELKWKITGTYGNVLLTGNSHNKDFVIDLSTQPKGIYYLTMNIGGLQVVRKLVRQ